MGKPKYINTMNYITLARKIGNQREKIKDWLIKGDHTVTDDEAQFYKLEHIIKKSESHSHPKNMIWYNSDKNVVEFTGY